MSDTLLGAGAEEGYASIAIKLKAPPPTSPSLCSIYHSAGFSLFTKDTGL